MKKILYIIPRFVVGGAEMLLLHTVTELQKIGEYEIVVAAVRAGGELEAKFISAGVRTFVASRGGIIFGAFFTWLRLRRFTRDFAPDIIHSHVFSADFMTRFLPRGRARWISTQHNGRELYSSLRRLVLRHILRRADRVIAVSGGVRDFCVTDLHILASRILLVINGVPTEKYRCLAQARLTAPFNLISVGRLSAQKNHSLLLHALAKLRNYDWTLNIYGEGDMRLELEFMAQSLKIADRVFFPGNVMNVAEVYCAADFVVQTSYFEGMSLVIMEAMAAGRTIVATRAAGEGIITDGVDGILVGDEDCDGLGEVLADLFGNPVRARTLAERAASNADNFSFSHTLAVLRKIYEDE
ncbi:MAG TPA: glycosyltransferase [Candidatus Magasanikbacteria bacterium]|nr:glycosyltransferase [Candidatus Magasanikbacteria bacterium]